jgi:hypothetical protein
MRCGLALFFCTLLFLSSGCAFHRHAYSARRVQQDAARSAALHWLALLDHGDYADAFEWEAQDFRMARTQAQFVRYLQARRAPFGRSLGRKLIAAGNVRKFVGVPDGNYVSILFKTQFENKSDTAERVILVQQPIGWRVLDYRIY